jgi:hypothetical protein
MAYAYKNCSVPFLYPDASEEDTEIIIACRNGEEARALAIITKVSLTGVELNGQLSGCGVSAIQIAVSKSMRETALAILRHPLFDSLLLDLTHKVFAPSSSSSSARCIALPVFGLLYFL